MIRIDARFKAKAKFLVVTALLVTGSIFARAQRAEADVFQNAKHLYQTGHLAEAERSFRELVSRDPSSVAAQMFLGQTLFREEKFSDAIVPYEKVRDLEKSGVKLTLMQHRILGDQLAMAYGISGRTADSKALLEELVRTDPEYPLNYYNLACVAADQNDKPAVLKNLGMAFLHRSQILPGEEMPDPAADPSFKKYAQDADFKALLK
jgi:predicted Zn-dependent protease